MSPVWANIRSNQRGLHVTCAGEYSIQSKGTDFMSPVWANIRSNRRGLHVTCAGEYSIQSKGTAFMSPVWVNIRSNRRGLHVACEAGAFVAYPLKTPAGSILKGYKSL
eukprot:1179627-Prorocentrum_minimum.AAC.4